MKVVYSQICGEVCMRLRVLVCNFIRSTQRVVNGLSDNFGDWVKLSPGQNIYALDWIRTSSHAVVHSETQPSCFQSLNVPKYVVSLLI